jgi:hypothetical protein
MGVWSIFNEASGLLTGTVITGSRETLEGTLERMPGFSATEGHHDHRSRRVDLDTGELVDYTPPPPTDAEVLEGLRWPALDSVQREIDAHERRQARPLRELLLGPSPQAQARLAEIDAAIVELRAKRAAIAAAADRAALVLAIEALAPAGEVVEALAAVVAGGDEDGLATPLDHLGR